MEETNHWKDPGFLMEVLAKIDEQVVELLDLRLKMYKVFKTRLKEVER